ncbi:hypothetical protein FA13DRAFT_1742478 [Coprinellus micaceus]|uniref:Uncharacterized protein n=1 Tax=Coprinellus micaceus TaxID=71717 RepID=A0A4Y7SH19_COPMI|nr:hypothetical protein FA13DRAFT_1742478 [Coprinellus micaceus]
MASETAVQQDLGLTVPLGWTLSDGDEWVATPDNVRALTGITRYSYTRMAQTQLPLFRLRFENTDTRSYVFNDSQGHTHPIQPLFIGVQELKINSIEGPSIVSVTLPLRAAQEEEASTAEGLDGLCTEISWPLTDEVKWVVPPLPVQARTGIKEYSYSWRILGDTKHYFLDIFSIIGANYVFKDLSGTEMKLSPATGGKHEVVSTHMDGGPLVSVCIMKN